MLPRRERLEEYRRRLEVALLREGGLPHGWGLAKRHPNVARHPNYRNDPVPAKANRIAEELQRVDQALGEPELK